MKTTHSLRSLSLFAILSVLGASAHAAPDYQPQHLAENGSQRATEHAHSRHTQPAQKLAENNGKLKRDRQRELTNRAPQQLAESDGKRSPRRATRATNRHREQTTTVAEGGSDRLLAWHAARTA